MYYEINVSKRNGRGEYIHFFATHSRSITDQPKLVNVYNELIQAFPEPEYNIIVSEVEIIERGINMKGDNV